MTNAGGVGALLQIADHPSGRTYVPTYDGNGNVVSLINTDSGAIAAVYEYSPFGEPLRAQAFDPIVADNPWRFSTKWVDLETGLVCYGRRYYDPKTGRWLSRDPREEIGGVNLYGFCGNNAVNKWDYLGMLPFKDANGFTHDWTQAEIDAYRRLAATDGYAGSGDGGDEGAGTESLFNDLTNSSDSNDDETNQQTTNTNKGATSSSGTAAVNSAGSGGTSPTSAPSTDSLTFNFSLTNPPPTASFNFSLDNLDNLLLSAGPTTTTSNGGGSDLGLNFGLGDGGSGILAGATTTSDAGGLDDINGSPLQTTGTVNPSATSSLDSGVGSAPNNTTGSSSSGTDYGSLKAASGITIQVGYTSAQLTPTVISTHTYVIVTDNVTGDSFAVRGGPMSGTLGVQQTPTGPDVGYNLGVVVGSYPNGFPDTPSETVTTQVVAVLPNMSFYTASHTATDFQAAINTAGLTYNSLLVNSNTVSSAYLQNLGVNVPQGNLVMNAVGWLPPPPP